MERWIAIDDLYTKIVDQFKQINANGITVMHQPIVHLNDKSHDVGQEQVQVGVDRHNVLASIINLVAKLNETGVVHNSEYLQFLRACYHDAIAKFEGEEAAADFRDASEFLDGPSNRFYELFTGMIDGAMDGVYEFKLPEGERVSKTQLSLLGNFNALTKKSMQEVIGLISRASNKDLFQQLQLNTARIQVFTDHDVDTSLPCFEAQFQLDEALAIPQEGTLLID